MAVTVIVMLMVFFIRLTPELYDMDRETEITFATQFLKKKVGLKGLKRSRPLGLDPHFTL